MGKIATMPLYREWSSDKYSLAAIWKMDEPESFFAERTGLVTDIKNEKRRIEYLGGRFLLKHLEEDFPLLNIRPDEHDKPRVDENRFYFSISHSWPYVAVVVSPYVECGIDIQCWHPNIERIQHKFLSAEEQDIIGTDPKLVTLAWSAKEAAYKWQGRRGVEFIDHMPIRKINNNEEYYNINIFMHLTIPEREIMIQGIVEQEFSCAFVIHTGIDHPFDK